MTPNAGTTRPQASVQSFFAGLDLGALTCKAVIVDEAGGVVAYEVMLTGARIRAVADAALHSALQQANLSRDDLQALVTTGYGRKQVDERSQAVTEITCHARGIQQLFPGVQLLLDVGGQDCKAIRLSEDGYVADFAMNDKCAAGTGRFFEVMARALEVDLEDLGPLALTAEKHLSLGHICTVFLESEVVGMLAQGEAASDVAGALCHSAAERVAILADRVGVGEPVALSGGVAKNVGFVAALCELLGTELLLPDEPQIVGALGAALIGAEQSSNSE